LVTANYLTWADKLRVAYGLSCLAMNRDDRSGETFAEWLARHGQSASAVELFWSAVLVSSLNERLDQMDVGHARKVMIDGYLRNRIGFQLELPLVPLGELYGTRLETWLLQHDVSVRLTCGARGVDLNGEGTLRGVILRDGTFVPADFAVLAVSFDRLAELVPAAARMRIPGLAGLESLRASPITGVHLWFDRTICPFSQIATPGRLIQWVFNHTMIQGRGAPASAILQGTEPMPAEGNAQYLQIVISASYDLLSLDKIAIRDAVLTDLARIWPTVKDARLLRWWVVTEHGATFSVRPGVDALRPSQRTPIDGLFLAGDWTATGWPATMEGAVRSGYLAAQGILADLDRPTRLVRPGLQPGRLARWLLGNSSDVPEPTRFQPVLRSTQAPQNTHSSCNTSTGER
jgi:squalene-associated FAD-dependent desaturase